MEWMLRLYHTAKTTGLGMNISAFFKGIIYIVLHENTVNGGLYKAD